MTGCLPIVMIVKNKDELSSADRNYLIDKNAQDVLEGRTNSVAIPWEQNKEHFIVPVNIDYAPIQDVVKARDAIDSGYPKQKFVQEVETNTANTKRKGNFGIAGWVIGTSCIVSSVGFYCYAHIACKQNTPNAATHKVVSDSLGTIFLLTGLLSCWAGKKAYESFFDGVEELTKTCRKASRKKQAIYEALDARLT